MPAITAADPRNRLVREKYFSLRPKPLERWLWKQGLPQAAERVFWLHWEEGMRARDWCSEIPLKRVASLCCIDPSTVTRAYQILKNLGLIRRESAGRDPLNPFQQATAITEVRVPRELLTELSRTPNRAQTDTQTPAALPSAAAPTVESAPKLPRPTREQTRAIWAKASPGEQSRYFSASRDGVTELEFDEKTLLTETEQTQLLHQLQQLSAARKMHAPTTARPPNAPAATAGPRRMSLLELARTRKRISETVAASHAHEVLSQVIWAVEEGALRRFDLPLALNIAIKKIRDGAWTKPNRMPPHWNRIGARAETCSAA